MPQDSLEETPHPQSHSRWRERLHWDRAISYTLLTRGWQFLAGPVTIFLVGTWFSPELQGFYYLFWNLLALQVFVELQLHVVILNLASHEWAHLQLSTEGQIAGEPEALSRLISLGRFLVKWYGLLAVFFLILAGFGGSWFMQQQSDSPVSWLAPWWVVVVLNSLLVWLIPFHAILEGCNQVAAVRRMQFWQAFTGNVAIWICIPLGLGLWVVAVLSLVRLFWELWFILKTNRGFFGSFLQQPAGPSLSWSEEIWPLQWRIGLKGLFAFFAFQLFNPVMFAYHGEVVAGQMGMTWSVLTALLMASSAWVQTRAPRFGMLVAERKFVELNRQFRQLVLIACSLMTLAGGAFLILLWGLKAAQISLGERFLPLEATSILTLAVILSLVPNFQWVYIHAHKKSPHLLLSCFSSASVGLLVWWLGKEYGPTGAAFGYLLMVCGFSLPVWTWVWFQCRREWQQEQVNAQPD